MTVRIKMQNAIFWKTFPVIKQDVMGLPLLLLKIKVLIKEEMLHCLNFIVTLYSCVNSCIHAVYRLQNIYLMTDMQLTFILYFMC